MTDDEKGSEVGEIDDRGDSPTPKPRRKAQSDHVSAWVLTAWMVLAPLLMLITIWVLAIFRKH